MPRQRSTEYIEVEGTEAVIYQRGRTWHMRVRVPDTSQYDRRTCGPRDRDAAVRHCREVYFDLHRRHREGISPATRTLGQLADQTLERLQRRRRVEALSPHMLTLLESKIRTLMLYWAEQTPEAVTAAAWADYIVHRRETGRARGGGVLSATTLRHEKLAMAEILHTALAEKLINHIPVLKTPPQTKGTGIRPALVTNEIKQILDEIMRRLMQEDGDPAKNNARVLLFHYVNILFSAGLRTNDIKLLRWRDIAFRRNAKGEEIVVIEARGKVKMADRQGSPYRVCVGGPDAADWIRSLAEHYPHAKPDDLLFRNDTGTGPRRFTRIFKRLVRHLRIETDSDGRVRTPYSLRHSYAMTMLNRKVSPEDLSLNMGCSVRMIERFYGSHRRVLDKVDVLT